MHQEQASAQVACCQCTVDSNAQPRGGRCSPGFWPEVHHTSFSYDLTVEYWEDFAEMAGIEMVVIDENTTISEFKKNCV